MSHPAQLTVSHVIKHDVLKHDVIKHDVCVFMIVILLSAYTVCLYDNKFIIFIEIHFSAKHYLLKGKRQKQSTSKYENFIYS